MDFTYSITKTNVKAFVSEYEKPLTLKYELIRGDTILGIVENLADDFPFHKGDFMPSDRYSDVALLFENEISLLEAGKMDEWESIRNIIDAPGIKLRPIDSGKRSIINPLIHIDGNEAWWR